MKILVLNGSPKGEKSNTYQLTQAFLEGMGEAEVRTMHVCRMKIGACRGCFCCWNKTPGKCVLSDDMPQVLEGMLWADIIVWSFPLYYFSVPGPLKNLIDRQLPMNLPFMTDDSESGGHPSRFDLSGKRHALISTCGFHTAQGNYNGVEAMFNHFLGEDGYTLITCGQGELFRVPELRSRTSAYLEIVRTAGREFAAGVIRPETKQKLSQPLFERRVFEQMADASWGVSRETGEKEEESLVFTRQMAALYNPRSFDGKVRVLEICYTDLDRTYQIRLDGEGSQVYTDGSQQATTRIDTPWKVWLSIAQEEIRGDAALAKGLYRVSGDFGLMMHWDDYFGGDAPQPEPAAKAQGRPSLLQFLAPWILFWAGAAIHPVYGAAAAAALCALMPLLLAKRTVTLYDRLGLAVVGGLSVLTLVTGQADAWIQLGYLLFGLCWLVSAFTREPLCAAYVKYDFGGDAALENPIFMKTNRILAAMWGVGYLIITAASFVLYRAGHPEYALIVLNVMTVAMGIFTGWFQNWYPAHVAGGK